MSDTWTLAKQLDDVKEDIKDLQSIAHEPIFTRELIDELFSRIDEIEQKCDDCSCGKKAKSKSKAKA